MSIWISKPPPGIQIDRAHPLAQGLIAYYACNEGSGLSIMDAYSQSDRLRFRGTPVWRGQGIETATASSGVEITTPTAHRAVWPLSIAWRGKWVATPDINSVIGGITANNTNASPYAVAFLFIDAFGKISLGINAAGTFDSTPTTVSPVIGTTYSIVGIQRAGGAEIWINGLLSLSNSTARSNPTYGATALTCIGSPSGTTTNSNLLTENLAIYRRAMLQNEIAQLYAQPYAMMRSPSWATRFVSASFSPYLIMQEELFA